MRTIFMVLAYPYLFIHLFSFYLFTFFRNELFIFKHHFHVINNKCCNFAKRKQKQ